MARRITFILLLSLLSVAGYAQADKPLPAAIRGFCNLAFAGKIAHKREKFNATDVLDKGVPRRRILGYLVGKNDAYLWYEHGGRSLHQHLVKFSSTPPYEVKASYVFDSTRDKNIQQLIHDRRFLSNHLTNHCGL